MSVKVGSIETRKNTQGKINYSQLRIKVYATMGTAAPTMKRKKVVKAKFSHPIYT
jgi:hypothetical protein